MPVKQTLVTTTHDVLLRIVAELDLASAKQLCLVHSHFVDACQARIHRTVDTFSVSAATLERLTAPAVLNKLGPFVRRARLHWSWRVLELNRRLPAAKEIDAWLLQRDELFARLLEGTSELRVATVVLWNESPYSTSFIRAEVDRLSLTRSIIALSASQTLTCLKVDFAMGSSYTTRIEQALAYPRLFLESMAQNSLCNVTHLSISRLQVPLRKEDEKGPSILSLVKCWLDSLQNLQILQLDDLFCDASTLVACLPNALVGLELLDMGKLHHIPQILRTMAANDSQLKYLRVKTFSRQLMYDSNEPLDLGKVETLVLGANEIGGFIAPSWTESLSQAFGAMTALHLRRLMLDQANPMALEFFESLAPARFPSLKRITTLRPSGAAEGENAETQQMSALRARYADRFEFETVPGIAQEAWTFAAAFAKLQ